MNRARIGIGGIVVGLALACALSADARQEGTTYQAFPSPAQEPGPPSGSNVSARATLSFDSYLTRARLDFRLLNLDPALITGFHIHCGLPGQLGPMIVDFGRYGDFTETFRNGRFSVDVTNDDIVVASWPPSGSLPEGCASNVIQPGQSNTLAGLEALARQGQLYFNLHTGSGQDETYFFGLIRGQVYPSEGR
ncbi:MAG: CHRD domain-containing protein [Thermodesulfobacteriota bacterium]